MRVGRVDSGHTCDEGLGYILSGNVDTDKTNAIANVQHFQEKQINVCTTIAKNRNPQHPVKILCTHKAGQNPPD